jgi:hypothetical protein
MHNIDSQLQYISQLTLSMHRDLKQVDSGSC